MAPVIRALQGDSSFQVRTCSAGQHRQMLEPMLRTFSIRPSLRLEVMTSDQSPQQVAAKVLSGFEKVLSREKPHLVLVQGDTSTVLAAALACFYGRVPVGHVEAGLRSGDRRHPFPEEGNRVCVDHLCELLFAPTPLAARNLLREGILKKKIFVTGNTVVDSLHWALGRRGLLRPVIEKMSNGSRWILVTLHRRESFGRPLAGIFGALRRIVERRRDVEVLYPVHLNPSVRVPARRLLRHPRIHLVSPLSYLDFIGAMKRSAAILTDSGGIQEEAPTLGVPVLVARERTERPEAFKTGQMRVVGRDPKRIFSAVFRALQKAPSEKSFRPNPYGDARAAARIVQGIRFYFGLSRKKPKRWS